MTQTTLFQETIARNIEIFFAALRTLDTEEWVACFAPDVEREDPVGVPGTPGHEGIREFMTGVKQMLMALDIRENNVWICGNEAAIKWTALATALDGKTVSFEGVDTLVFDANGKVKRLRAYWNPNDLAGGLQ